MFTNDDSGHQHSLSTLNLLYEHDDFMDSVTSMIDMGCGAGLDIEWWATRTTRDMNNPRPLNIRCTGVDIIPAPGTIARYKNAMYHCQNFEVPIAMGERKFDVIWCHDAFQYVIDPITTLKQWRDIARDNGMLVLILPQTTNIEFNKQKFEQKDGCYWHWTMVNLIHVLAVSGWDCSMGRFLKRPNDPWLHAVVYKSKKEPMDPRTTKWYTLAEQGLLPESAARSVMKHGYLRQQDLLLSWLDKSLMSFDRH